MPTDDSTQMPKRSALKLLSGVLLRPKNTFSYLKDNRKKAWWLAALCVILFTIVPLVAAQSSSKQTFSGPTPDAGYGMESGVVIEGDVYTDPNMVAPSQPTMPMGLVLLPVLGAIVGQPIGWLIWGGALYLASVFMGRSSGFRDMFRLVVWTRLPFAVRGLIQTVYILLSGQMIVNKGLSGFAQPASLNPLLPPSPGQLALAGILQNVDLYLIWTLFLIATGFVAFTGLSRKNAWIASLAIWCVLTLVSIIPALLGGMFLG